MGFNHAWFSLGKNKHPSLFIRIDSEKKFDKIETSEFFKREHPVVVPVLLREEGVHVLSETLSGIHIGDRQEILTEGKGSVRLTYLY